MTPRLLGLVTFNQRLIIKLRGHKVLSMDLDPSDSREGLLLRSGEIKSEMISVLLQIATSQRSNGYAANDSVSQWASSWCHRALFFTVAGWGCES